MLEACEETLRYHGYEVCLSDTPDGGIAAVQEQTFDLMRLWPQVVQTTPIKSITC